MNIGAISYSISAFAFFIFLAVLLTDSHRGKAKRIFIIAATVSFLWSCIHAYQSLLTEFSGQIFIVEYAKSISWVLLLSHLLSVVYSEKLTRRICSKFTTVLFGVLFLSLVPAAYEYFIGDLLILRNIDYLNLLNLAISVLAIVLLEQVYRNTRLEQKWAIKYLCLGLLGMFVYDFYMYANALLYHQIDYSLWQARGFIYALTVPLLGISVSRDPLWSPEIFISRSVVFHTTTLLASGIYLVIMGIAGYYVRDYGGSWGLVAQALFLFITILVLALFIISRRIRSRLNVFVNKHFYPYKYDYREEWARFINTISVSSKEEELYQNTIKSISQIVESPGGLLWLREDNGFFVCADSWGMDKISEREPSEASLPKFLADNEFVICVDEYNEQPEVYTRLGHLEMPAWLSEIKPWLIVPLIYNDLLIGYIILNHAHTRKHTFNWEDSELLKTAARQVAAFLEQMNAAKALAEAKQFESFNKVSTYIIHDIKNLITQLSLISSNAEKHKGNPLFMDDVFKTINNSVGKMNKMMGVLSGKTSSLAKSSTIDIIPVLEELVHNRKISGGKPIPILGCESSSFKVKADKDQLLAILGHLVQNAQDATNDDGKISIHQKRTLSNVIINIDDNGTGMSEDFIKYDLFKPFKTTKGDKGMGIGVYEAREIIHAIGGDIDVKSQLGIGTSFTLTIPGVIK